MEVKWTKDQKKVIELRNRNILVSAAAGSGKTAVLVERIIQMITDKEHPIDIDRLLIVTFTNAAAGEMRERISAAIEEALKEKETDEHLQRQLALIHNAQITTIDSFCLYVVRNHFYEIDIEPNFRIADEGELKLLREDVIKSVLKEHYKEPDEAFKAFMEGYSAGKSDDGAVELILGLYDFSRSYPWPKKWLENCKNCYEIKTEDDLNHAVWIEPAVKNIQKLLQDITKLTETALKLTEDADGPSMYAQALESDIEMYQSLNKLETFVELYYGIKNAKHAKLKSSRGYTGSQEKLDRVKTMREEAKTIIKKLVKQYCFITPELMIEQLQNTAPMAKTLIELTEEFAESYAAEKRRKNIVDFYDVEHFALKILVDEETGKAKKTAEEFRDTFEEIMIDEYQDSNYVQEAILTSISRIEQNKHNIFMVGDVKQSIYRFRLARPELFMEKYDTYSIDDSLTQKIDLHQNFRSRNEVLEVVNDIFYRIMGKDLGNVAYDDLAALHLGASYPETENMAAELLVTDSNDELLEDTDYSDKKLLEAKLVATKIHELLKNGTVTDKKTKELREVRFSDIVILLRSLSGWTESFVQVLNEEGIPAYAISQTGYFSTVEVQTVLSMLRILDNPRQDIPLTAVLRSPIGNMTDEELGVLRLFRKEEAFHVSVLELCKELKVREPKNETEEKLILFYKCYENLRARVVDTPIHELIKLVLKETGYGEYASAMPSGARRRANLDMLLEKAIAYEKTSYKGLFHFVRYIDELQKYQIDFGEADLISENENVVRIMSIHKSKGLEFPIVFVSGLGKNFNMQDTRSKVVLHPEYGVGMDYMDGKRRIKAPTIAKRALAKQIELENLGEELRVLYVALTRAKEKLILTGSKKEIVEKIEQYKHEVDSLGLKEMQTLSYLSRERAVSYLDWVIPAMLSYKKENVKSLEGNDDRKYKISCILTQDLVKEEVEKQVSAIQEKQDCLDEIEAASQEYVNVLTNSFAQNYPYLEDGDIAKKNKYSVSELKQRTMREAFEEEDTESIQVFPKEEVQMQKVSLKKVDSEETKPSKQEQIVSAQVEIEQLEDEQTILNQTEFVPYIPKFVGTQEESVNFGILRGTAIHRMMECYDFTSEEKPREQLQRMKDEGRITEELSELIHLHKVSGIVKSKLGERMKKAAMEGKLYREKPFVMGFTDEELVKAGFLEKAGTSEELTLIQGMIDVFWIEEDGIVLLDYKTDSVEKPQDLKERYGVQLCLYEEALNRRFSSSGLRVKEKLIYSFKFGKVICVK